MWLKSYKKEVQLYIRASVCAVFSTIPIGRTLWHVIQYVNINGFLPGFKQLSIIYQHTMPEVFLNRIKDVRILYYLILNEASVPIRELTLNRSQLG